MCQPNNDVTKGCENGWELPIEWYCCILLPHTCSSTPWQCTKHSLHLPTLFEAIRARPANPSFHVDRPIVQSSWPTFLILLDSLSNRVLYTILIVMNDDEGCHLEIKPGWRRKTCVRERRIKGDSNNILDMTNTLQKLPLLTTISHQLSPQDIHVLLKILLRRLGYTHKYRL